MLLHRRAPILISYHIIPKLRPPVRFNYCRVQVYELLSAEDARQRKERGPRQSVWDPSREGAVSEFSYVFNNGWIPGTLGSSLSTNAVMRQ